jgi:hypothetical protein
MSKLQEWLCAEDPARALRRAEIGCTFSLGRKFKTEIPGEHAAD